MFRWKNNLSLMILISFFDYCRKNEKHYEQTITKTNRMKKGNMKV